MEKEKIIETISEAELLLKRANYLVNLLMKEGFQVIPTGPEGSLYVFRETQREEYGTPPPSRTQMPPIENGVPDFEQVSA